MANIKLACFIANGLPLVTQESGIAFILTGLVLLIAASVTARSPPVELDLGPGEGLD